MFDWEPTTSNIGRAAIALAASVAWMWVAYDVWSDLYRIGNPLNGGAAAIACLAVSFQVFDWNWPK